MDEQRIYVEPGETGTIPVSHTGSVAMFGDAVQPRIRHDLAARVEHVTEKDRPLVHMVCWDTEPCPVVVRGEVTLVGDPDRPIRHEIVGEHRQTMRVDPLDHSLHVQTKLAEPIHHALQMRTPLQLRFCNPWHVASDYRFEIKLWDTRVISVRLTGATVATPQPCEADDCPPVQMSPTHP
jgi:hypothetical protein